MSWKHVLNQLVAGQRLRDEEIAWAMDEIMRGQTPDAILGAFLLALHTKGETPEELNALAQGMLAKAEPIDVSSRAVDIVGTGGDMQNTVNISTMASLVTAGAGVPVIKHGNRSSSSSSGSADVLEALGVDLGMSVDRVAQCVQATGITFLFAQVFHPSMRFVAPVRKTLGVPTAFNYLGPMTNPAQVQSSAIGVANPVMAEKIAQVFAARENHALVFRGTDGLDEITITGETAVWETHDGVSELHTITPEQFGYRRGSLSDLRGGDASHNARVVLEILSGCGGAIREAVVLNAAAGILAFEEYAPGDFVERFDRARLLAERAIDSGAAMDVLEKWKQFSRS